jgi:hypothetical protein
LRNGPPSTPCSSSPSPGCRSRRRKGRSR